MTHNIRSTSMEAYFDLLQSGQLQEQEYLIVSFLHTVGATRARHINTWRSRKQIAKKLGLDTSTVAGRVNRLVKNKILEEDAHRSPCPISGRNVIKVRLK